MAPEKAFRALSDYCCFRVDLRQPDAEAVFYVVRIVRVSPSEMLTTRPSICCASAGRTPSNSAKEKQMEKKVAAAALIFNQVSIGLDQNI